MCRNIFALNARNLKKIFRDQYLSLDSLKILETIYSFSFQIFNIRTSIATHDDLTKRERNVLFCIEQVLFDLAYSQSPTIIFIDEIDWITTRIENDTLSEPAKRFRSELLARLDGLISSENSNVVLLAATNAPW